LGSLMADSRVQEEDEHSYNLNSWGGKKRGAFGQVQKEGGEIKSVY